MKKIVVLLVFIFSMFGCANNSNKKNDSIINFDLDDIKEIEVLHSIYLSGRTKIKQHFYKEFYQLISESEYVKDYDEEMKKELENVDKDAYSYYYIYLYSLEDKNEKYIDIIYVEGYFIIDEYVTKDKIKINDYLLRENIRNPWC